LNFRAWTKVPFLKADRAAEFWEILQRAALASHPRSQALLKVTAAFVFAEAMQVVIRFARQFVFHAPRFFRIGFDFCVESPISSSGVQSARGFLQKLLAEFWSALTRQRFCTAGLVTPCPTASRRMKKRRCAQLLRLPDRRKQAEALFRRTDALTARVVEVQCGDRRPTDGRQSFNAISTEAEVFRPDLPPRMK